MNSEMKQRIKSAALYLSALKTGCYDAPVLLAGVMVFMMLFEMLFGAEQRIVCILFFCAFALFARLAEAKQ